MGFCAVTQFLKSCQKLLFSRHLELISYGFLDLSKIHKMESFLTSFSTLGTKNILAEINLEKTGVMKGCSIILGQKFANTCSFVQLCAALCTVTLLCNKNRMSGAEILIQNLKNCSLNPCQALQITL
jgi:hypothetical protein